MKRGKIKMERLVNIGGTRWYGSLKIFDIVTWSLGSLPVIAMTALQIADISYDESTGDRVELPQTPSKIAQIAIDKNIEDPDVLNDLLTDGYDFEWIEPLTEITEGV